MSFRLLRFLGLLAAISLCCATLLIAPSTNAQAAGAAGYSFQADFVTAINQSRAANGLQPLVIDPDMAASAAEWTSFMVDRSHLGHASSEQIIAAAPAGQSKTGENVGRGRSISSLFDAFMRSPAHRNNILDPAFTHIGVAVEVHPESAKIYTTHRFASIPSGVPPAPPLTADIAPPAPPTPAPAAPRPAGREIHPLAASYERGFRLVLDATTAPERGGRRGVGPSQQR